MTQVKLKCVLDDCDHETVQLDFDQARSMLDLHMKYAHPTGGASGGDRKPEKFPRPEISIYSIHPPNAIKKKNLYLTSIQSWKKHDIFCIT